METQLTEKERVARYYGWENDVNEICNRIQGVQTSTTSVKEIAKSLSSIVSYADSLEKGEIVNNLTAEIPIDGKPNKLPFKTLYSFIIRKGLDQGDEVKTFNFGKIKITGLPDNPYAHPLSKSLGIQPVDKAFFENNEIITEATYDKIFKGKIAKSGFWNTDLQKAVDGLKDFVLVKKLIHNGEKTYVAKYYAKPIEESTSIGTSTTEELHKAAYDSLQKGWIFNEMD